MSLIKKLKDNIINMHGEEGSLWIKGLPNFIDEIVTKYNIVDLSPVNNMTFNYVASGNIDNVPIILKYGMDKASLKKESTCIKAFSDHGGVRHFIEDDNLIIMEKAMPGSTLKYCFPNDDDQAIKIMCDLIHKLHTASIPKENSFYYLKDLFQVFDEPNTLSSEILSKSQGLREKLLSNNHQQVLLHGDLHHDNILKNGNDYVAIDPKGFIGEPLFDVAAFIINPMPDLIKNINVKNIIINRISLCASLLDVSKQDISDWVYIKSVICLLWSQQDNLDGSYFEKIVKLLGGL